MAVDPLSIGLKIINKFVGDKDAKREAESELRQQVLDAATSDIESHNAINIEQAKSDSFFICGPRAALMWACVLGQVYAHGGQPIAQDILLAIYKDAAPILTTLEMGMLNTVTIALFGIRSGEKHKGVARNAMALKDGFFSRRRARKQAKKDAQ